MDASWRIGADRLTSKLEAGESLPLPALTGPSTSMTSIETSLTHRGDPIALDRHVRATRRPAGPVGYHPAGDA
jgi:hypothetical protein